MHTPSTFQLSWRARRALQRREFERARQSRFRLLQGGFETNADLDKLFDLYFRPRHLIYEPKGDVREDWELLSNCAALVQAKGPGNPHVRAIIRYVCGGIYQRIALEYVPSGEQIYQSAAAIKLMADAGVEATESIHAVAETLGSLVRFYLKAKDWLYLGRALIDFGNACRLAGQENRARTMIRHAVNILERNEIAGNRHWPVLFSEAVWWDFRMNPTDDTSFKRISRLGLLKPVEGPITAQVNQARELTAFWVKIGDLDRAEFWMERLRNLQPVGAQLASNVPPTLLRPQIELLLLSARVRKNKRDLDEAIELIRSRYVLLYERDRRRLQHRQLVSWSRAFGLDLEGKLSPPEYESPIITFTPRCEMVAWA